MKTYTCTSLIFLPVDTRVSQRTSTSMGETAVSVNETVTRSAEVRNHHSKHHYFYYSLLVSILKNSWL